MIEFSVNQLVGQKITPRYWRQWLSDIERVLRLKGRRQLSIAVVSTATMRRLNWQYRRKNRATDVLSFAERDSRIPMPRVSSIEQLGEVIICYPKVVSQARTQHRPIETELQRLFIHGVMHLLGHDHQVRGAAARMEALERRILGDAD